MIKNNCLLLIFPKKAGFIFIFTLIVVFLLTTVSKNAFAESAVPTKSSGMTEILVSKDTIYTLFQDNFETGNLSGWKQTEDWEVSPSENISGRFSLKHSDKSTSGISAIFHTAASDWNSYDLEWTFTLKNGNWDPSSSNRFWFYPGADTIQPELINGWAVGVNISGSSDLLELWRIKAGKPDSLIVQSDLDWNASALTSIHVKRTARGIWLIDYQKSGEAKSRIFSGTDNTLYNFKNTGLCFNYTPTRAGQLWIDDITICRLSAELFIQTLTVLNSNLIKLTFNKPINTASVHFANFRLADENNRNIPIIRVLPDNVSSRSVELSFGKADGLEFSLRVSGISDFPGKIMNPDTRFFSYSFSPEAGSLLINEILFNPFPGGVDFIELVNVSETSVPVHRLMLATRNDTLGLKQIYPVSTGKRTLNPGEFLVCTKDPAILSTQYMTTRPESFCAMKSFPTFSDDAGIVVLLNDSLEMIDEFSYSAKMHSPFLADEEGVSLERISLEKPTADRSNWASAAASVGFATPGTPNSQTESETEIKDEITPDPKAFSPNGDGYNDELSIRFKFSKPGYIANVRIFDAAGRQVKFLAKNESQAQEGNWMWNGTTESGQKLNLGVYIILVEVFDQDGHSKVFKKTCSLTDRLD